MSNPPSALHYAPLLWLFEIAAGQSMIHEPKMAVIPDELMIIPSVLE